MATNPPNPKRTVRTRQRAHEWKPRFLEAFRETRLVKEACRVAGVGRTTVYEARQQDEEFALAWADLEAEIVEEMEAEAYRRAVEGVTKPLVSAGKYVTDVTEYSDGLLMFLLKARKPHEYRERVDVNHAGQVRHKVDMVPVAMDRGAEVAGLLEGIRAIRD